MTNPGVGWFQLTRKYEYETVIMIMSLEIIWLTRYPSWQDMHTAMNLDLLVLSFKILLKFELSIYAIMAKLEYPWDNSSIVQIYQGTNLYNVGIDKTM